MRYGSLPGLRSGISGFQQQGQRGGEQETARLGGRHGVDRPVPVVFVHQLDRLLKGLRLGQQRRDVLEKDARLGKIGNVANVLREVH